MITSEKSTSRWSQRKVFSRCSKKLLYWSSLYALVIEKDPFMVQFFEPTVRSDVYWQNDLTFEVLSEDFVRKMEEPELIPVGRSQVNY